MKVNCELFDTLHLDKMYSLLHARGVSCLKQFFELLDIHGVGNLNDIQFCVIMDHLTDLSQNEIYRVFEMLDLDGSGEISFDEFYLLVCVLLSVQDGREKQFIYRHSRAVFDLLDEDSSGDISAEEFENFGFLFNFHSAAIREIFTEFDVTGDQEIDYKEFRMFAMACVDKQNEILKEENRKKSTYKKNQDITQRQYDLVNQQRAGYLELDVIGMDRQLKVKSEELEQQKFYSDAICTIL